ncbi:MAG: RecB-family nuclease [Desulfurococcaceae archaeon]
MIYAGLYGESSVQRVLDFVQIAMSFEGVVPVLIRPIGAAAQIGVPEAFKISLRRGRPIVVLPEILDLANALGAKEIYYVGEEGGEENLASLIRQRDGVALVLASEGQEPSKKELAGAKVVWPSGVPRGLPPAGVLAIVLYNSLKIVT